MLCSILPWKHLHVNYGTMAEIKIIDTSQIPRFKRKALTIQGAGYADRKPCTNQPSRISTLT